MKNSMSSVDVYDANTFLESVPVVDGKWEAKLAGLSDGPHHFKVKAGSVESGERVVVVETGFVEDDTGFENGWGKWEVGAPCKGEIVIDGANQVAKLTNVLAGGGVLCLSRDVSDFKVGVTYKFDVWVRNGTVAPIGENMFRLATTGGEAFLRTSLTSQYRLYSVEFTHTARIYGLAVYMSSEKSQYMYIDRIRLSRVG